MRVEELIEAAEQGEPATEMRRAPVRLDDYTVDAGVVVACARFEAELDLQLENLIHDTSVYGWRPTD